MTSPGTPRSMGALGGLSGFLRTVRRRRRLVLAAALAVAGVAILASLRRTPSYRSEAKVLVQPITVLGAPSPATINMVTEEELAQSDVVVKIVLHMLDAPASSQGLVRELEVSTSDREASEVLIFTYAHPDPVMAEQRAQSFADAYMSYRRADAAAQIRADRAAIQREIPARHRQIRSLTRQAASTANGIRRTSLLQQAELVRGLIFERMSTLARPKRAPDVGSIVQPASVAIQIPGPSPIVAAALGLILGLAAALTMVAIGTMDNRPSDPIALAKLAGASVLASIPYAHVRRGRRRSRLVTIADPSSKAAGAYRGLRTTVLNQRPYAQVLLVTSADTLEGKSTVAANLAASIAQSGSRVVLVDCNLSRPSVAGLFGDHGGAGLVHVLAGTEELAGALRSTGTDGLEILTAGRRSSRFAEMLTSPRFSSVLDALSLQREVVILDGPAISRGLDALSLALRADAVVLVADAAIGDADAIRDARARLDGIRALVLGAVLNNAGEIMGTVRLRSRVRVGSTSSS